MILPDVNVLIYAFRADSNDHLRYKGWLDDVVNGPAVYGVSPHILASVVRICSHPKIYRRPSATDEVLAFCEALLSQTHAAVVEPGPRHWSVFKGLCSESKASGNLIPDAWNAALAIESGCEWTTTDGDYARFKGLRWRRPF